MARFLCVIWAAVLLAPAQQAGPQEPKPPEPYRDARKTPGVFVGPGREATAPPEITEVLIGWFGPSTGPMWDAAQTAISELNARGGHEKRLFRLVPRWSENPWKSGPQHMIRMAYGDNVWSIIAAHDGAAAHLAEQVAMKALVPVMNPVATDRSLHTAGVPWLYSCAQGDDAIAATIAKQLEGRAPVVVASTTHDSRALLRQLQLKVKFARQIDFEPGHAEQAARAVAESGAAVLIVAGPADGAEAVKALRAAGHAGPILGGPSFGRAEFRETAGPAAKGVLFPKLSESSRFPDYASACAYDCVRILAEVIRTAGLNRERIREGLRSMKPYQGASGLVQWDVFGQNARPVAPARYE